jgi:hypothetical protein
MNYCKLYPQILRGGGHTHTHTHKKETRKERERTHPQSKHQILAEWLEYEISYIGHPKESTIGMSSFSDLYYEQ